MKIEHEVQALVAKYGYPEVIAALARRAASDGRQPLFRKLNSIFEWMTGSPVKSTAKQQLAKQVAFEEGMAERRDADLADQD